MASILVAKDAVAGPEPAPSAHIDLSPIGYRELSRMDRLSEDEPNQSLDFLDADHVLITFNRKKMFQRSPEHSSDHEDRVIHAVVLDVNTNKVLKETDWYLHDRRRYLWAMGHGNVLLRRQNDLYILDSNLQERLLLKSPKDLLWVSLTPGGGQIITETAIDSPSSTGAQNRAKFEIKFVDVGSLHTVRTVLVRQLVNMTGTSSGYADLIHKNDIWLVRFGPSPTRRRNIIRVRSQTPPDIFFPTENSMIVGRCPSAACDYSTSAFALSGNRLWRQHWPKYRVSPEVARSDDNSRVAIGTLQLSPAAIAASPSDPDAATFSPDTQPEMFVQQVQVLETATGTSVLKIEPSPAVVTGQNFSLSPDGGRFAVISGSTLDLYSLPAASPAEGAKFAELRSDISKEFPLASIPDTDKDAPGAVQPNVPKSSDTNASTQTSAAEAPTDENQKAPESVLSTASTNPSNPPSSLPTTVVKVSSRAVLVDVVVTDRKGVPVRGLHQEDFAVLEDGAPQRLHSFQEFADNSGDQPTAKPAEAVAPKPSPNVFSNKARGPDSGAIVLVLFDMLNTPPQDQAYARDQLIKFLSSKPKDMQFALCTMSSGSSHLQLVQGFTSDDNVLVAAAKGKKNVPRDARWDVARSGTEQNAETVQGLAREGQSSGFQNLVRTLQHSQVQQQVMDTNERAGITLDSMMSVARYLSGIPGRKNMVWLSGSFPVAIAASTNSGNYQVDNPNYNYKIRQVTNLLAESQVAVYPVDVRGMVTGALDAGNAGAASQTPSLDPRGGGPGSRILNPTPSVPQNFQAYEQEAAERDTLLQFALATGGTAFLNTNGIRDAIATASEQGSNYYTLSYSPTNKAYDGKFRKIIVQLAQKGYTLHYRRGYYADEIHSAARDAELARRARFVALQHASPIAHQFAFSVRIAPVGGKKKIDREKLGAVTEPSSKKTIPPAQLDAQHYLIDYSMDGSEPTFQFKDSNYSNTLLLMVAAYDHDGNMLSVLSSVGVRHLQQSEYEKTIAKEFGVQQEVDIPVDAASVRIGIQDQMSNHLGTVDIPLPVPPDPAFVQSAKNPNPIPELEKD